MTSFKCLEFLLFLFLLHQVYSEEPEPVFRAKGNTIEMGYCFGVDYIVVFRSGPEGDQLLGNSSANNSTITSPADLRDRVHVSQRDLLLGLQIGNLTRKDSGIYRRECWQDQTLVSQFTQQLFVCDEEVESKEIIVKEEAERTELLCNSTSTGLEGTSVRWYYEMYPSYKITLFLDSNDSLEPLVEELQGVMAVKYGGALLTFNNSMLKNIQHFHCLVIKGKNCLSYQNLYLPDRSESRDIFASQGDKVVLNCPSDGNNQQWETPLGTINGSSVKNNQLYISVGDKLKDFSLVIPEVTDEHSGDYSCISSSLELQYFLVLCPKNKTQEKIDFEGENFSLECNVGQDDSQRVQWYHRETSGEYNLIHDSNKDTVPIPEDLMGRLTLSDSGFLLTISDIRTTDAGVYRCVVLRDTKLPEGNYEYEYDYPEEHIEDDEYDNEEYLPEGNRCIFKQETTLTLIKTQRDQRLKPVTTAPGNSPTKEPVASSNTIASAVGAGLVGLLVVGVIAAVIAIKKKKAKSRSGQYTNKDIKMKEDPGCTDRLTNDEHRT